MDKIIIQGGVPLHGRVQISGSKNAALPCLFATLLTDEKCIIEGVPRLADIDTACSLLSFLGKKISRTEDSVIVIPGETIGTEAPYDLVRKMRASVLVLGPLLARKGRASASLPGGCAIGNRPIDIHLAGLKKLGADANLEEGMVQLSAKKIAGRKITLSFPSVGATENLLMASALASGETTLKNAAREPEIVDLVIFLKKMGARIEGAGTNIIRIQGEKKLNGAIHRVIPDRIETATYLIAAAITKGSLKLEHTIPEHLTSVITCLSKAGLKVIISDDLAYKHYKNITCSYHGMLKPVSIVTGIYPHFPTDVQAQWMALMALAHGRSRIKETIFENRYLHAAEMRRMGAEIEINGNIAEVNGIKKFSGANVMVSDLRAGAAMIVAGLAATGTTVIHRIYHLDRGYEKLEVKLRKVGAKIRRVR